MIQTEPDVDLPSVVVRFNLVEFILKESNDEQQIENAIPCLSQYE